MKRNSLRKCSSGFPSTQESQACGSDFEAALRNLIHPKVSCPEHGNKLLITDGIYKGRLNQVACWYLGSTPACTRKVVPCT
ncbi:hypothetical protein HOR81_gp34 [Escherichia phage ST32]|uniref:Uncharacterized protein n=1 Tax=Escherichia phage ST32 TaxID=2005048 RepID=A0A2U9DT74_9CAUD|nr:hypothetical protein HOR81_gp34 [Escherichia phage ST32]AWP47863.1 hypothetical protein ST32_0034 [Escherichia phage ST32]